MVSCDVDGVVEDDKADQFPRRNKRPGRCRRHHCVLTSDDRRHGVLYTAQVASYLYYGWMDLLVLIII